MRKLAFLIAVIITFITCKKEDAKIIDNLSTTNISTYQGTLHEYGGYVSNNRIVHYDTTSECLLILVTNSSNYSLHKVSSNGDTTTLQKDFTLNHNNVFADTSGFGLLYRIEIKLKVDSLFVNQEWYSKTRNMFWEAKAAKAN